MELLFLKSKILVCFLQVLPLLGLLFIAIGIGIMVMALLVAVEHKVDGLALLPSAISVGGSDDLVFYPLCLNQIFLLTAPKT